MTQINKLILAAALVMAGLILITAPGMAVQPGEMLDDPALEHRARVISQDIRCLVCQNQSIDDSNADLARDLRIIVRERLVAGDSNDEVKAYLVDRYGDYVLLTPPFNIETLLLWGGPVLLVLIGLLVIVVWYRGRRAETLAVADGLSPAEQARLKELLASDAPTQEGRS